MKRSLFVMFFFFWISTAYAASFDIIHFRPDVYPGTFLSVAQPTLPQPLTFHPAFFLDYSYKPLSVQNLTGVQQDMLQHLAIGHVGTSFGLTETMAIACTVPVVFEGGFQQLGGTLRSNQWGIGSMELSTRYRIKRRDPSEDGVGFAIEPFLKIPSGYNTIYISHDTLAGGVTALMDLVSEPYSLALNMRLDFQPEESLGSAYSHHTWTQSIALGYHTNTLTHFFEFHTQTLLNHFFENNNTSSLEVRYGFSYPFSERTAFIFSVGTHILPSTESPIFRSLLGLKWNLAPKPKPFPEVSPELIPEASPTSVITPEAPAPVKTTPKNPRRFLPIH